MRQENLNACQIKDLDLTRNEDVYKWMEIPLVKDLPEIAAMYGLYSTFILMDHDLYFVFGLSKELIQGDEFVCVGDKLYAVSQLEQEGYYRPCYEDPVVYSMEFEARKITDELLMHGHYTGLAARMERMEYIYHCYKMAEMEIPKYAVVSDALGSGLHDIMGILQNPRISDYGKVYEKVRLKAYMKDTAIWEWPIQKNGKRPGLYGFLHSRYCIPSGNLKKLSKLYKKTYKWDDAFYTDAYTEYATIQPMEPLCYEYIAEEFNKRGILYREYTENKKKAAEDTGYRNMVVSLCDAGLVDYLIFKYTMNSFDQSLIERADDLRHIGKLRYDNGERILGYAEFYLTSMSIIGFSDYAKKYNIIFGIPYYRNAGASTRKGIYIYVAERDAYMVEELIRGDAFVTLSRHGMTAIGNSRLELRLLGSNGLSAAAYRKVLTQTIPGHNEKYENYYMPYKLLRNNGFLVDHQFWRTKADRPQYPHTY